MQVPERLALIGGSILLSSTLIFTLKSQASSIIPNVSYSISGVFNHIGDAQRSSNFDSNFQDAQKNGEATGTWGSSKYYIDKGSNIYIGSGKLQDTLENAIGTNQYHNLKTINIVQATQAPQNSYQLFSSQSPSYSLTQINGLDNLDTSGVNNMDNMFFNLKSIKSIDVSHMNTFNVTNTGAMFDVDDSLTDIQGLDTWDTSNLTDTGWMFYGIPVNTLNLSSFNTNKAHNMMLMYGNSNNINKIILGENTKNTPLSNTGLVGGNWKNGSQVLNTDSLNDGSAHPGTWIKQ